MTQKTVQDVIRDARALIDTPEKWQQGTYHNDDKTCFCLLGAFNHVAHDENYYLATDLVYKDQEIRGVGVVMWNDHPTRTHDDVMALFDRLLAS